MEMNAIGLIELTSIAAGFNTADAMLKKNPIGLVEHAVKGMLPKNRLGSALYKNMHVYVGTAHPHEAQKPRIIEL